MIVALHAGLGALLDEGLEASWARHAECGRLLHEGLEKLGFTLFAAEGHRLPELTTAWVPEHVGDEAAVRRTLLDRYGIEIGGGLGAFAGKVWRIGCMGHTARPRNVTLLLGALGEVLGGLTAHDVVWAPPLDGTTNVERFMQQHGITAFDELVRRSIEEPEWFWAAVVEFLDLPFATPWDPSSTRPTASRGLDGSVAVASTSRARASTAGRRRPPTPMPSCGRARTATASRGHMQSCGSTPTRSPCTCRASVSVRATPSASSCR